MPDPRNSQILKIIKELKKYKNTVSVFEPEILPKNMNKISKKEKFKIFENTKSRNTKFDLILYCLDHKKFKEYDINKLNNFLNKKGIIFDLTKRFNSEDVDGKI